jgi:putative membrane protein
MLKKSLIAAVVALSVATTTSWAKSPADLNDLEMAHVAYTADNNDIRYAHLALAISKNPKIHAFARTMIRDHSAVNDRALALVKKLKVQPKDNFFSRQLNANADKLVTEMSKLSGRAFDRRYAENELGYHKAVNQLIEKTFIPNIKNAQVKALFREALAIFKIHQKHAEMIVKALRQRQSMNK